MPDYRIRQATLSDALVIARHRVDMFQEMGELAPDEAAIVEAASRARLVGQLQTEPRRRAQRARDEVSTRPFRGMIPPIFSGQIGNVGTPPPFLQPSCALPLRFEKVTRRCCSFN